MARPAQSRAATAREAIKRQAFDTDLRGVRQEEGVAADVAADLAAHVGAGGAVHANAVASGAAGFMTGADKAKLDGIASGATAYTDEMAQDTVAAMIAAGTHTGITFTYTDGSNKIDAVVTAVGITPIKKAGSTTRNNNTLSDDPHLTVALAAATAYYIRVVLHYSIANATMDFKYRFNYTGTLTSHMATRYGAVAGAAGGTDNQGTVSDAASINVDIPVLGTTSGVGVVIAEFSILTNAAGTFSVQWAQNTTDAGNCIMHAASSMVVI